MAPEFDAIAMSNGGEAAAVSARLGLPVDVIPNAVPVQRSGVVTRTPVPGRLLFVGNLTYQPNIDAVTALADRVLPALRREVPDAHLVAAGPADVRLSHLAGRDGITLLGFVDDLAPVYAS